MTVNAETVIGIGEDLLRQYPEAFGDDFRTNERAVQQLTDVRSKYVRNRVAGYVTRNHRAGP